MAEIRRFRTFQEMASVLALNTPHALVLDWWRRLDRCVDDYFRARGLQRPSSRAAIEKTLESDPEFGPKVADQIRALRRVRNVVAHQEARPMSVEEAFGYAETAWQLGWRIATYPTDEDLLGSGAAPTSPNSPLEPTGAAKEMDAPAAQRER